MSTCRSCSAPIIWARTTRGKAIPLDAQPTSLGNIEVDGGNAMYVTPDVNALGNRYVSHFVTCPQAKEHRAAPSRKKARA